MSVKVCRYAKVTSLFGLHMSYYILVSPLGGRGILASDNILGRSGIMKASSRVLIVALWAAISMPVLAQDIVQSRGIDQGLDYSSLTRFGPWDDRNYNLILEDLEFFSPNEEELYPGIPAFFRVELRKEWPHLMKTGPAQYPRAALQLFRLRYGGLMQNGLIERRVNARDSLTDLTVTHEIKLNDVLEANEVTVEINPVFPFKAIAG